MSTSTKTQGDDHLLDGGGRSDSDRALLEHSREVEAGDPDGNLRENPLADLLFAVAEDCLTGVLRIEGGSEIWFTGGRLCLARTASSPPLVDVLSGAGLGAPDDVRAALDDPGSFEQLVASRTDIERAIARVIHEYNLSSVFEMLVPSKATYRFDHGAKHGIGAGFAEDTDGIVEQAKQRVEIWRRIAAKIPSTAAIFTLATTLPNAVEQRLVTADEWRFLSLLDGTNTVADVIAETGESAFRVCSSLYRLLIEDLVIEARQAE